MERGAGKTAQFDLEERTLRLGKEMIRLAQKLPKNTVNRRLVDQVIRSGTSVGANYREANETETKKDFKHRIMICRKEAKETNYWLKLATEANPEFSKEIGVLLDETMQLVKIFAAIGKK